MKTTILTLVLIALLGVGQIMADNNTVVEAEKENTINVVLPYTAFVLEEEDYIDDIPFNTEEIAKSYYEASGNTFPADMVFTIDDEDYIDDIPFNTEMIAKAYLENKSEVSADEIVFALEEEEYIDDIPFDTEIIYQCHNNNNLQHCEAVKCLLTKK